MNKTKIEWCDYTWNPVVGCKHGCSYCYAKKINDRFKMIPKWKKPVFFPGRLDDPDYLKKPATIFVGSMCDLFGKWIPKEWIQSTINTTVANPRHKFMFLTKNPMRYGEFNFPPNCWLGATITKESDNPGNLFHHTLNRTFISVEPILGGFERTGFCVDLVIVGADSNPGASPPKKEWIESIKHDNIFYKQNIRKYL